jgi:hypothetical protein
MSYLTNIQEIFNTIAPGGTFMFESEVRADDVARNLSSSAFPLFVVDDNPLEKDVQFQQGGMALDNVKLHFYVLTKYDLSGNEVEENKNTRFYQHEQCVTPMEMIASRVMGKFVRENPDLVAVVNGARLRLGLTHKFNLWSKMLYGVEVKVSNLFLRRQINYCNTAQFLDTDIPGDNVSDEYVPDGT